jgi:hypothetical protein
MPDITITRHGDRWAIHEAPAQSPTSEYETRDAAEQAARRLADGGAVEVRDEDPTGLDEAATDGPQDTGAPRVGRVDADDVSEKLQSGL